jgi:hypothetical protein
VAANRVLTGVTNVLYGSSLTDMETCYKVMRPRSPVRSISRQSVRHRAGDHGSLLRRGYRIRELPVRFDARSRAQGKKIGWRDGVRAVQVLVAERFRT